LSNLQQKVSKKGLCGILLKEVPIDKPYIKNYDDSPEGGPLEWASPFELANWGFFMAIEN
jgi:hypothetical protein